MSDKYNKIDPDDYMVDGVFDSSKLVGVPIKLGRDKEVMELFDDITKQLINESLAQISDIDDKTFVSFRDDSAGYPVYKVKEDRGEGVMVMFNENGSLSLYDEKVAEVYREKIEAEESDIGDDFYEEEVDNELL